MRTFRGLLDNTVSVTSKQSKKAPMTLDTIAIFADKALLAS